MISIITPVLNGANFIEKNIKAIQKLNIPFEHIIVDGGSNDGTLEIVKKYPHLILLHQNNGHGMYHAIDLGFEISKGEIITWVNADDVILKGGFETLYEIIVEHKCDVVYSNGYFVDLNGKKIKKIKGKIFAKYFLSKGMFPFIQPSALFTKEIYKRVGGFNWLRFKIVGDLDLFYKFAQLKDINFKRVDVVSVHFLKYGDSLGDNNIELALKERHIANIPLPNLIIRILNKILIF